MTPISVIDRSDGGASRWTLRLRFILCQGCRAAAGSRAATLREVTNSIIENQYLRSVLTLRPLRQASSYDFLLHPPFTALVLNLSVVHRRSAVLYRQSGLQARAAITGVESTGIHSFLPRGKPDLYIVRDHS